MSVIHPITYTQIIFLISEFLEYLSLLLLILFMKFHGLADGEWGVISAFNPPKLMRGELKPLKGYQNNEIGRGACRPMSFSSYEIRQADLVFNPVCSIQGVPTSGLPTSQLLLLISRQAPYWFGYSQLQSMPSVKFLV